VEQPGEAAEERMPIASPSLAPAHHRALMDLMRLVAGEPIVWALTGSLSHRLQGVSVDTGDIDVQSDRSVGLRYRRGRSIRRRYRNSPTLRHRQRKLAIAAGQITDSSPPR